MTATPLALRRALTLVAVLVPLALGSPSAKPQAPPSGADAFTERDVMVPARDGVLHIYRESSEVAAVPLKANEEADVCVEVPGGMLRLAFSDSEQLPDGRRVSFKLRGTTLFDAA